MSDNRIVLDSHCHFWELERFHYMWPTEDTTSLYQDFLPEALEQVLRDSKVDGVIFVQVVNNTTLENDWIMQLAEKYQWIVGVVGWVDLTNPQVEMTLRKNVENSRFLGVRHILDFESPSWLETPEVQRGLAALEKLNLTFDLLLRPKTLHLAASIASTFPSLRLIINHLAKPNYKDSTMDPQWMSDMERAAKYPNVFCKLSGTVSEAGDYSWNATDFQPYIEHCVSCFGAKRCMFGSDFPVYRRANATYKQVYDVLQECLHGCTTPEEREGIFGKNAVDIYKVTNIDNN